MSDGLLLKGFEVELFTGRPDGSNVGVANDVVKELTNFVTEPDRRNLEESGQRRCPHSLLPCQFRLLGRFALGRRPRPGLPLFR